MTEYINKIDPFTNIIHWLELLNTALIYVGGEKEFIAKHWELENNIFSDIKTRYTSAYNKFKKLRPKPINNKYNNNNLYSVENSGGYFISIDLKSAGYQMLKMHNIINDVHENENENKNKTSWEQYILTRHIDNEYFSKLKQLRIRALNKICHSTQKILWENLMLMMLDDMVGANIITKDNIVSFNSDEFIMRTSSTTILNDFNKYKSYYNQHYSTYDINIEPFKLVNLAGTTFYAKINVINKTTTFKCVNYLQLTQAIDLVNNTLNMH
jgi:hypothetical protein